MLRHQAGMLLVLVLCSGSSGAAQAVPSRLTLFTDPVSRPAAPGELVLGTTTLDEARQLFPDAPPFPGPFHADSNPYAAPHSKLEVAAASVRFEYVFWLGPGRAALYFDRHQRLVSISQGAAVYRDPSTGKAVAEAEPWADAEITRNAFRDHYPGTTGEWFDRYHYRIEGMLSECLAMTAWLPRRSGTIGS